ncbi:MAG: undecaprenyl/decaprenyl-phosphate alpha-N-acetylglucosaminyl 1-phosphate transferase [Acidobacteriaceae bacterium]|nr:undecaprenyl/decaprenyl-phosphate alpha-N-acetylglucosaminyl 1-phosphate transferase [Acidobacteriaceae bacterium]MBV8570262.1 undecaprenyl/decaprenyl-phosphate alpha-N-acetylglucosaminyl 1-phosphate transferase [Acidobacteriaceae bacterium]
MYLILTSGLIAFLLSLVLTPVTRDIFGKLGIVDHPDAIRKFHTRPIPRVGGIAIAVSYVLALALVLFLPFSYGSEIQGFAPSVLRLFCAAAIVFATGLFDDLVGYRPWQKLAGQVWAALLAYLGGVQTHVGASQSWNVVWNLPLSILWMVGCANAFNLIDGLDGLAAGVGLFATLTTLVAALLDHNLHLALVTMPLAGCLAGFLRYNFNPASVFLGDSGSLLVGFLLGCYGLIWGQHSVTLLGLTAPLLAISIPLLDTTLAVFRRFLRDRPIFAADCGHIHHKLLARGLTVRRTALLMYASCGFAAALSLLAHALKNELTGLIILLFCVAAWIGIQHLGYTEFATVRQLFLKRSFRRIIDTQSLLQEFEKDLLATGSLHEVWAVIVRGAATFHFASVRLCIRGAVFEQTFNSSTPEPMWEMRLPLSSNEYINFRRAVSSEPLPFVGNFLHIIHHRLAACPEPQDIYAPVLKPVTSVQT